MMMRFLTFPEINIGFYSFDFIHFLCCRWDLSYSSWICNWCSISAVYKCVGVDYLSIWGIYPHATIFFTMFCGLWARFCCIIICRCSHWSMLHICTSIIMEISILTYCNKERRETKNTSKESWLNKFICM
jgi:hypothetical protein